MTAATLDLAAIPRDPRQWRRVLFAILLKYNRLTSYGDRLAARKTSKERRQILFGFFRELRQHGHRIDPRSLGRRHIELMVRVWKERGLSAGTIQNNLSALRCYARWIGKGGLVGSTYLYADSEEDKQRLKRPSNAQVDRSWTAAGVSFDEVIARIDAEDRYVGAQMRLCRAFGLRVKEALMLDPWRCIVDRAAAGLENESPHRHFLAILRGAKGRRQRYVPIEHEAQWEALAHARAVVGPGATHMGRPGFQLHQNYIRVYSVLRKCGVTRSRLGISAHGLRHEYAHRQYERHAETPPPVVQAQPVPRESDHLARLIVSERLGHSRKHISGAYLGGVLAAREQRMGNDGASNRA